MIMYFAVLNRDGWDWIFVFFFTACAVMRLARFNVEQAGAREDLLPRAAEPRGRADARDVLLVQPDRRCTRLRSLIATCRGT